MNQGKGEGCFLWKIFLLFVENLFLLLYVENEYTCFLWKISKLKESFILLLLVEYVTVLLLVEFLLKLL